MQLTFVLGIHRSGTSLLAAGLEALGCDLGTFVNKRNYDNQTGEFEHGEIVAFNDRLLTHMGASWDNWGLHLPSQGTDGLDGWLDEAATLMRACFVGPGPVAVKDPRITTLLPFWSRVLGRLGWSARHVMVIRPPAEVAASQRHRAERNPAGFPIIADAASMSALWAVHSHAALLGLPESDLLLIRHDALYTAPESVLAACTDHLGLSPDPARRAAYLSDHVSPSLRRAKARDDAPSAGSWEDMAARFYADLAPAGHHGLLPREQAQSIARRQRDLERLLPTLPAIRQSLGRARSDIAPPQASARPAPEAQAINAILWGLSGALVSGGRAELEAVEAQWSNPAFDGLDDLGLLVARARIAEKLGRIDAAAELYRRMGRVHPDTELVEQMERDFQQRIAARPLAAD